MLPTPEVVDQRHVPSITMVSTPSVTTHMVQGLSSAPRGRCTVWVVHCVRSWSRTLADGPLDLLADAHRVVEALLQRLLT